MTHHERQHGHQHEPGSHPGGFEHHAGECPYCKHGSYKRREDEINALRQYREDINRQLTDIDRRIEELKKA